DENSNRDMGVVIRRCDRIRRAFDGCTVRLVHHTPRADVERERGAGALRAATDSMLLVTIDGTVLTLTVDRQKNGPSGWSQSFVLQQVPLDDVADGSCVVRPVELQVAQGLLSKNANAALNILVTTFEGKVSHSRWEETFMATTGLKESSFNRAFVELRAA